MWLCSQSPRGFLTLFGVWCLVGKVFDLKLKKYCTVYVLMLLVLYIIFHDCVISCTLDGWMYGWIDNLRFMSFSTLLKLYQGDGRERMKGCVQWNSVYDEKPLRLMRGLGPGPLHQEASA